MMLDFFWLVCIYLVGTIPHVDHVQSLTMSRRDQINHKECASQPCLWPIITKNNEKLQYWLARFLDHALRSCYAKSTTNPC